jgi:phosphoserine phosphatase
VTEFVEHTPALACRGISPPLRLSDFKLIAFDLDSTLIDIECIDEIADAVGKRAEVAAITESAMQGRIADYRTSLRERVALLAGAPLAALHDIRDRRMQLNPGAEALLQACRSAGLRTLLVSGGFTVFTDRVRDLLQLDETRSNQLEVADGHLTGRLVMQDWGDLCDGEEKRRMVLETCTRIGCAPSQAMAVGDGANDVPMMRAVGLSVSFHGKPCVREEANVLIDAGGLDRLLEVVRP